MTNEKPNNNADNVSSTTDVIEKAKQEIVHKNYAKAKELLDSVKEDGNGDRNYYWGIIYAEEKSCKSAEKSFKEAISVNEKHIGAYLSLSELYQMEDDLDSSKVLLEKAYGQDPTNLNVISYLAGVYMSLNEFDKALPHLRRLYDKAPQEGVGKLLLLSLESLASKRLDEGNLNGVEDYANEMIQINDDYNGGYKLMGMVSQKRNDYKLASDYFTKAFQRLPNDINITNYLTQSLIQIGDYNNAKISNNNALSIDPDNVIANEFIKTIEKMINN